MGLFSKKIKAPTTGLYGKHPTADDFLRLNASSPAARGLDDWLVAALATAERAFSDFDELYPKAPPISFISALPAKQGSTCMIGRLAPSTDRIGRRYPLVLFGEVALASLAGSFSVVPLVPFMDELARLQVRRAELDRERLMGAVEQIAPPTDADFAAARQRQERMFDELTVERLFDSITPGADHDWLGRAVSGVAEVCGDVAGGILPRFSTRLPLGSSSAAQVSFWLRFFEELGGGKALPSALWTTGVLVVYFTGVSDKALLALWDGEREDESIYDAVGGGSRAAVPVVPSAPVRSLLRQAQR